MRILIADDHPIVRHGLKQMLAGDPSATVVGEATNGDEVVLQEGDGAFVEGATEVTLTGATSLTKKQSEVILFDLV